MDNSIYAIYFLNLGLGVLVMAWMLFLQLSAYHKNGDSFFKYLSIATGISIFGAAVSAIPYLFHETARYFKLFMVIGTIDLILVGGFTIIGSKQLFDRYTELKLKSGECA